MTLNSVPRRLGKGVVVVCNRFHLTLALSLRMREYSDTLVQRTLAYTIRFSGHRHSALEFHMKCVGYDVP